MRRWEGRTHLFEPADLLLQLALPRTAVVLLQAQAAAAASALLHLESEELQVFQLLAEVLDELWDNHKRASTSWPDHPLLGGR